jgi:hypothetical protein
MVRLGEGMKKRQASGPAKRMSRALGKGSSGVPAPTTDISENFRRARSSIADITTDLQQLRRRATSVVKSAQRPAKSK